MGILITLLLSDRQRNKSYFDSDSSHSTVYCLVVGSIFFSDDANMIYWYAVVTVYMCVENK